MVKNKLADLKQIITATVTRKEKTKKFRKENNSFLHVYFEKTLYIS